MFSQAIISLLYAKSSAKKPIKKCCGRHHASRFTKDDVHKVSLIDNIEESR